MITRDDINALCAGLPAVTHVVQWGGSDVWKVGGKVFAIISWARKDGKPIERPAVSFKVSELSYEILREQPASGLPLISLRAASPGYRCMTSLAWKPRNWVPISRTAPAGGSGADQESRKSLGILTE